MRRREFIVSAIGAGLGVTCIRPAAPTTRILVLGGTNFVGPAIVETAVERGHEVTLFNRGITRPHLFPGLEKIRGDRTAGSAGLSGLGEARRWDAVIDVWPQRSDLVSETARALRDRCDYYYFVSSIAVYADFSRPGMDEDGPIVDAPGTYGGEKALAETAVREAFPERHGIARCHAILGPRDDGTAYHYWLRRLALSNEVLAPGTGEDPFQYVDVRDLAMWIVDSIELRRSGTYNVLGPEHRLPFRTFLERTRAGIGSQAQLTWVDADYLRGREGVYSFTDMPLWAPLDEDEGFYQFSNEKAVRAGLAFRPLEATAADAWMWYRSHFFRDIRFPAGGHGMTRAREEEILERYRARG